MKKITFFLLTFLLTSGLFAQQKNRVIILTDIENEPDDAMSLVRYLTYSNQFDTEAIIATTSVHQKKEIATWRIKEIVTAYGKVKKNLELHEPGYSQEKYLHSITKEGKTDYGMNAVGEGMDSEGSDYIIERVDADDERPVWVLVWGGPNCLAQALWKVKNTRTQSEVEKFVSKLRVYTISDQDNSGPWIRKTFPNLFYIASPGFHSLGGYHYATWTGISGDNFHGRFDGSNFEIVDNPWLDKNIRSKGPLGEQYPWTKYLMEGDSPSFMYLINNGLGSPENPNYGSWGGRYEFYRPRTEKWFMEPETRPLWTNAMDEVFGLDSSWHTGNKETIWRWREAYQNDFLARMDWTLKSYEQANHPPQPKISNPLKITAKVGETITLDASNSTDPDGNNLSYEWIYYPEPGSFTLSTSRTGASLKIENHDKAIASIQIPRPGRLGTMHIILAITDDGSPALTRYQRIIINVTE